LYEIERTKNYEENSYNYEKYSIIKHTTILASEKVVLFKWVVKTGTKEYEFENLMPYDEEN
jgi:hypothetical protein